MVTVSMCGTAAAECALLMFRGGKKRGFWSDVSVLTGDLDGSERAWRGSEYHQEVFERQRWRKGGRMPLMQPENRVKIAFFVTC